MKDKKLALNSRQTYQILRNDDQMRPNCFLRFMDRKGEHRAQKLSHN